MNPTLSFWTGAVALALLACLLLVWPTSRPSRAGDRQRLNLRLRRDQLSALDQELAAGHIAPEEHRQATREVERAVLEEVDAQAPSVASAAARNAGTAASAAPAVPRRLAAMLALAIAVVAFGLYGFLGNIDALDVAASAREPDGARVVRGAQGAESAEGAANASPAAGTDASTASVEAMLDSMAERMASQREGTVDAAGWALVARSYAAMQRFDSASRAYARAIALTPDDAQLLADQADVLSMLQDRRMAGEPIRLATRALQIDPANLKALALAGTDAFDRRDFNAALDYWSRARRSSTPGDFAREIDRNLAAVREAMEHPSAPSAAAMLPSSKATAAARLRLQGRVVLSPELAGQVSPTDTVFVFAREVGSVGRPMATARYSARDLPIDFTLDADSAMVDSKRFASASHLVVGARISRSGDAIGRTGEPRGTSEPIAMGRQDIAITIDDVTP